MIITSTSGEIDTFLKALGWMITTEPRRSGRLLGDQICFTRPGRLDLTEGGLEGRDYFWSRAAALSCAITNLDHIPKS